MASMIFVIFVILGQNCGWLGQTKPALSLHGRLHEVKPDTLQKHKINVHDAMRTPCSGVVFLHPFWTFSQLHDNINSDVWVKQANYKTLTKNSTLMWVFALCLIDRLHQLLLTLESLKIQQQKNAKCPTMWQRQSKESLL